MLSNPKPETLTTLADNSADFLPPAQEDEFLPPIGRWVTFGGLFIVAIVGLAIPLAAVLPYRVTVKAQATVRPTGELQIVQSATGGLIKRISVTENQSVQKGDVIATLDDSRLHTQKSQLQSKVQQAQQQLIQINAQIGALNSQIAAETDRSNRATASAVAELGRRRRDYRDRQIVTAAEVEEAKANFKSAQAALNAAKSKRNRYQSVAKQGALSKDQLEEAKLAAQQQQQAVEAAQARVQNVKAALNPSQAEVAIANEQIAQEKATGAATLATLAKEREALIQQRIEIQKQLERDGQELQQLEVDLSQTIITAPANGVIFKLNLRNSGQTVQPGEEIAHIAPSQAKLVLKALVPGQEISKVKVGQKAQLRVSACPYPDYGTLKGKVSAISPDAIAPPASDSAATNAATASGQQARTMGDNFYEIRILPESSSLGQGKNQCSVELGMGGRADIISREETVLKFLLRKARLMTDL